MDFNADVLSSELNMLLMREKEMQKLHEGLYEKLQDPKVKDTIRLIRDQEIAHVKMVKEIIAVLYVYM